MNRRQREGVSSRREAITTLGALLGGVLGAPAISSCSSGSGEKTASTTNAPASTISAGPVGPEREPTWDVGACLSLTGADAALGTELLNGISLGFEAINAGGKIAKREIRLLHADNKSKPDMVSSQVAKLVDEDNVVALIGDFASSRSKMAGEGACQRKLPILVPATSADVTTACDWVFRVCYSDETQARSAAKFSVEAMGKTKVGVLYADDDTASTALAKAFEKEIVRLGGSVVASATTKSTDTGFAGHVSLLRASAPDIVFAALDPEQMLGVARAAKSAGLPQELFLGVDSWSSHAALAKEMQGAYHVDHFAADSPWEACKQLVATHEKRYSKKPSAVAALGYDAAILLGRALLKAEAGGIKPESVRQALRGTQDIEGATGVLTMGPDRAAKKTAIIVQIRADGRRFVASI